MRMREICFLSVRLEGEKERLEALADMLDTEGGFECVDFNPLWEHESRSFLDEILEVKVENILGKSVLCMDIRLDEYYGDYRERADMSAGIYYKIGIVESEEHWTNDIEGKYFNQPFFVDLVNDQGKEVAKEFSTYQDVIGFVKKSCSGIPDYLMTIEKIDEYLSIRGTTKVHPSRLCYYYEVRKDNICTHKAKLFMDWLKDIIRC